MKPTSRPDPARPAYALLDFGSNGEHLCPALDSRTEVFSPYTVLIRRREGVVLTLSESQDYLAPLGSPQVGEVTRFRRTLASVATDEGFGSPDVILREPVIQAGAPSVEDVLDGRKDTVSPWAIS